MVGGHSVGDVTLPRLPHMRTCPSALLCYVCRRRASGRVIGQRWRQVLAWHLWLCYWPGDNRRSVVSGAGKCTAYAGRTVSCRQRRRRGGRSTTPPPHTSSHPGHVSGGWEEGRGSVLSMPLHMRTRTYGIPPFYPTAPHPSRAPSSPPHWPPSRLPSCPIGRRARRTDGRTLVTWTTTPTRCQAHAATHPGLCMARTFTCTCTLGIQFGQAPPPPPPPPPPPHPPHGGLVCTMGQDTFHAWDPTTPQPAWPVLLVQVGTGSVVQIVVVKTSPCSRYSSPTRSGYAFYTTHLHRTLS